MKYILSLSLVFFSNFGFYLFPWVHIPGVFNMTDIGLLVIAISILFLLFNSKKLGSIFLNYSSYLVLIFLIILFLTVSLASFKYHQSIIDGFIAVRDQFYYLSFFVFLYLFKTLEDVRKVLVFLTYISLFLVGISIVNHFSEINIFYHKWADGHGIRSGVKRAWIPAMPLLAIALFWNLSLLDKDRQNHTYTLAKVIFFFSAFVFRQTRGQLIGVFFGIIGSWFLQRKYVRLLIVVSVIFPVVVIVDIQTLGILSNLMVSSGVDMIDKTGTWDPRVEQINFALQQIRENPIIGTGADAIRGKENLRYTGLSALSYKADLGYLSFVKAYGFVGALWLLAYFYNFAKLAYETKRGSYNRGSVYSRFCIGFMLYVLVSFVTINHFMYPNGIVCLMFVLAVLERVRLENYMGKSALEK